MGFLGDVGRALVGMQPKGDSVATQPATDAAGNAAATSADPYYAGTRKIIPEVEVLRLEVHRSGDHIELWAHVKNHSEFEVELGRINILGQHIDPTRYLKPGEQYEVRIFSGDAPKNDGYHKAEFFFRIVANGDYFCADHRIEYGFDDGRYIPEDLKIIHPIRDV